MCSDDYSDFDRYDDDIPVELGGPADDDAYKQRIFQRALMAFENGLPPGETPLRTYIESGRSLPWDDDLHDIRYCPGFYHSKAVGLLPAMLAALRLAPGGDIVAVQATFLTADGTGKAKVKPSRKVYGSARGAAIWLSEANAVMALTESIEKAIAIRAACRLAVASAYSAGNMPNVQPPPQCTRWIIAADRGDLGELKARQAGARIMGGH